MTRRQLFGGLAALFVGGAMIIACPPITVQFTPFSYAPHERPRVFVSHHPLRALPGQIVTVRLAPDLRSQDGSVASAFARLGPAAAAAETREEKACAAQNDGTFACEFTLPGGDGDFIYDGRLELASHTGVSSRVAYRFRAAAAIGADDLIALREPVKSVTQLAETFRVDTVWVRDDPGANDPPDRPTDRPDNYAENDFLTDVEIAVYDGILADPVYRWRDAQLAFYAYGRAGVTSSYYSGLNTRCGQNPWPGDRQLSQALAEMEVIGVLHRHVTAANGTEGEVEPAANLRSVFRDCAGGAARVAPGDGPTTVARRTFATTGGGDTTPRVAKHEFGHAAFGLGDEYSEPDETRNVDEAAAVTPGPLDPPTLSCCCVVPGPGGFGGAPGGASGRGRAAVPPGALGLGAVQCVVPGGGVETRPGSGANLPECPVATFDRQCGAEPQGGCPPLTGDCVQKLIWKDGLIPPDTNVSRPNSFTSRSACDESRARAAVHPGVEDSERGLGTCRQICGPGAAPCPCGQGEAWIVDTDPVAAAANSPDTMASIVAPDQGGTCAWCVETSLCVRWHEALGDNPGQAWAVCETPPSDAVEQERGFGRFVRAVGDVIRQLTRHIQF